MDGLIMHQCRRKNGDGAFTGISRHAAAVAVFAAGIALLVVVFPFIDILPKG